MLQTNVQINTILNRGSTYNGHTVKDLLRRRPLKNTLQDCLELSFICPYSTLIQVVGEYTHVPQNFLQNVGK